MQVLVALVACLTISSAFLLPPVPSSRPPHALKGDGKLVDFDGLDKVSLRPAKQDEKGFVQRTLLGMLMNPLSIDMQNFICAEDLSSGALVGFGQIRPIGESNFELASLHVAESHRQRGIGSCLVRQLMKEFVSRHGPEQLDKLYLLTMASTARFYEKSGFAVAPPTDVPTILKAERALGTFVLTVSGGSNSLVCMQASSKSTQ